MKISFFRPYSFVLGGGAEKWMLEVSMRLSTEHEINVICLKYASERRLSHQEILRLKRAVNYYEFPFIKPPRGAALPHPFYLKELLSLINSSDATYVFLPSSPLEMLLYLIKQRIKSPLIAGFHGFIRSDILLQKLYIPLFKKNLKAFEAYHALNKETYCWLKRTGFYNIFHIPNGVNTEVFQLCEKTSNLQSFNILFTGRLTEDKGADKLVEIIRYINEKLAIQNIKFTIAGSGSLGNLVEEIAQNYDNVQYLGFVPPENLSTIYRKAHLFLMPSRVEGMPLTLLEAQSCGLPVVGSRVPGISDVIVDGKTGCLTNVEDVHGFAEAIKKYCDLWRFSPEAYYELNKAIRELIVNNYDWNIIIRRLEEMFMQCVSIDKRVRARY